MLDLVGSAGAFVVGMAVIIARPKLATRLLFRKVQSGSGRG